MTNRDRQLLRRAHDAGVVLSVDGDRVKYRAPMSAMTEDLRNALRELKPTLVYEYHERAGILEYHANMPRFEAEAKAAETVLLPYTSTSSRNSLN